MPQQKHELRNTRYLHSLILLVLSTISFTGCGLTRETHRVVDLARRTTFLEPSFYDYVRSDRVAQREARLLAEQAWAEASVSVSNASPDYENGFTEGFADFLYRGGEGEPPLIPPRGYWNLRFLNQFGKMSTNDWYDGFRHGAQNCKASGLREMWVVPTSLLVGETNQATPAGHPGNHHTIQPGHAHPPQQQSTNRPSVVIDSKPNGPSVTAPQDEQPPILDSVPVPPNADRELPAPTVTPPRTNAATVADPVQPQTPDLESLLRGGASGDDPNAGASRDRSDPFGNDPQPVVPQADPPGEVDVFGIPEDAFDSSESFQPDVDDEFDFSMRNRGNTRGPTASPSGPLAIRSVQPVSQIPADTVPPANLAPIVLASGELEEDLPPPPSELPMVISTPRATKLPGTNRSRSNAAPRPPRTNKLRQQQPARATEPMPVGRPRMQPIKTRPQPSAATTQRPAVNRNAQSNSENLAPLVNAPMRIGARPDDFAQDQPERKLAPLRNAIPLRIKRSRAVTEKSPAAISVQQAVQDPLDWMPEAPPVRAANRVASAATGGDLQREAPPQDIVRMTGPATGNLEAIPHQSPAKISISSDEWQPFVQPPAESVDFAPPQYDSVLDDGTLRRSTQWTPQRESELPLRVSPTQPAAPVVNANSMVGDAQLPQAPQRMVIQPSPQPVENPNLKMRPSSTTGSLPKIYLQQPTAASQAQMGRETTPTQSERMTTTTANEPANNWQFRN